MVTSLDRLQALTKYSILCMHNRINKLSPDVVVANFIGLTNGKVRFPITTEHPFLDFS